MQLFTVLLRQDGLAFAQQQLPRIADHIHRQGLAHLQHGNGNRNVLHKDTSTGTRAANAHINSYPTVLA